MRINHCLTVLSREELMIQGPYTAKSVTTSYRCRQISHHILSVQTNQSPHPTGADKSVTTSYRYRQISHHILPVQTNQSPHPTSTAKSVTTSYQYRQISHHVLPVQPNQSPHPTSTAYSEHENEGERTLKSRAVRPKSHMTMTD